MAPRDPARGKEKVKAEPSTTSLLLIDGRDRTHLIDLSRPRQELPGVGRFSTALLSGARPGGEVELAGRTFRVLEPSLVDHLMGLKRGPQWVTLKDGAWLVAACGLRAGDFVAEAGAGSGALTIQLAWAVGPTGRVVSLDNRPEHLQGARRNVARAGLAHLVEFHLAEAAEGLPEPGAPATPAPPTAPAAAKGLALGRFKAVVLDLPEPWEVVEAAAKALAPGGWLAAYLPTVNQVERLVTMIAGQEQGAWGPPQVVENLQRSWAVKPGAVRPQTRMLGHTGFCVTARWLGEDGGT